MKSILSEKRRKILRIIYGTLSFSTALFVFQACYGTPRDMEMDVLIQGSVTSEASKLPIPGIKVSVENQSPFDLTDDAGKFKFYVSRNNEYKIMFEDVDSTKNGTFLPKDTVVSNIEESTYLAISLDVK